MDTKCHFYDASCLLERLVAAAKDKERRPAFLFGSALTAPVGSDPGVPNVMDMVRMVADELDDPSIVQATSGQGGDDYQRAFRALHGRRGQDAVNRLIRKAVLRALKPGFRVSEEKLDEAFCRKLVANLDAWHLSKSVASLGQLLARYPASFGEVVLTTNFDPLIEIAVEHAHGRAAATALHGDGSWLTTFGNFCHVVHLHGYWIGSDTLHAPESLQQSRPKLRSSLAQLLEKKTLVVIGYGGWKDIISQTLSEAVADDATAPDILWCFFSDNEQAITAKYSEVFSSLSAGFARGRVSFFKGINTTTLIPALLKRMTQERPADSLKVFLAWSQREFERRHRKGEVSESEIGEWTKLLRTFEGALPAQAALAAAEYVLPIAESAYYRNVQRPEKSFARLAIEDAHNYLASPKDPILRSTVVGAAMDARQHSSTVGAGSDAPARLATGVAAEAALAVISLHDEDEELPSQVHAAKAVHMAYRVRGDDQVGVWNWISARLWHLGNDQS